MSKHIVPVDLIKILQEKSVDDIFVDIRNPDELKGGKINGTVNIPLESLEEHIDDLKNHKNTYLICAKGGRCKLAVEMLSPHNINAYILEGGIASWEEAELPLE